eukprot:5806854-Pyramimonas_sp.AAC.1
MRRRGAQVDIRAPRQRARFTERRGTILRRALRAAEEQQEREGIAANFDSMPTTPSSRVTASPA